MIGNGPLPSSRRPAPPGTFIDLRLRWAAAVLGLAALGAGGTAVFVTEVEAGPAVLLLVGLVLILISMSGRLPNRLKVGENEAAWEAVQEYVRETVEEASPDEKARELARVAALSVAAPQATPTAIESYGYQIMVSNLIDAAIRDLDAEVDESLSVEPAPPPFDLTIVGGNGTRRIYVLIRTEFGGVGIERAALGYALTRLPHDDTVLIATDRPEMVPQEYTMRARTVRAVRVVDDTALPEIRSAIRALLELEGQ